jgi:hypothetical protein
MPPVPGGSPAIDWLKTARSRDASGPLLSQPAREGADKVAVSLAAKHVKHGEASLPKARAIVLTSALP